MKIEINRDKKNSMKENMNAVNKNGILKQNDTSHDESHVV